VEFQWYEPVHYYEDLPFPNTKLLLARWLGVTHHVRQALCYWLINDKGKIIACMTIQKIPSDEMQMTFTQEAIKEFDDQLNNHLNHKLIDNLDSEPKITDNVMNDVIVPFDKDPAMPEEDDMPDEDTYDEYISARVLLPPGVSYKKGTVTSRKCDNDGILLGKPKTNPILDTRVFEVQFLDGTINEYATNVIAENILAMVDDDGHKPYYLTISLITHVTQMLLYHSLILGHSVIMEIAFLNA
jgi:hypothetical protein